jgi:hypothetical protein
MENLIASSWNLKAYAAIITNSINTFNMLAIIKVLENVMNFFSLALINSETNVRVIPAKSSNRNGQNFVINVGAK